MLKPLLLLALLLPINSLAQEEEDSTDVFDLPEVVALQNRAYFLDHGVDLHLGYLPIDAFNKGVFIGSSYTYYFSQFTGWEVLNANYNFNIPQGLQERLNNLDVDVQERDKDLLDFINWFVTSSIVYTPMYNKSLLFNRTLVNGEGSLVFGLGVGHFDIAGFKPMATLGTVIRFFLGQKTSINVDIREHIYFNEKGVTGLFAVGLGFSYQLGDSPNVDKAESEDEF